MSGRTTHLSVLLLIGIVGAPVAAQAPHAPPAFPSFHATLTTTAQPLYIQSDTTSKRTYWLEGGAIGAGVLGVTAFFVEKAVANSLCSDTGGEGCHDYRTVAIVGSAALGFLVGSLIGRGHAKS